MEWYVTNSSDTNLGTVQSHLGTVRMSYMYGICGVSHFCGKTACQKYFFQIDSKKQQQKNAQVLNLKNPDLDLIRRIHPECGFYGFTIRFWICPRKKKNPVLDLEIRI